MGTEIDKTTPELPPGFVWREGKIFEVGDHPTHNFSLSEEEADRAIAEFQPLDGDLEHRPSVLSGKVGKLARVWRDGKALFGGAVVPEWLDAIFRSGEREPLMSCEWHRRTKKLEGWGWVLDPAIPDAALFSAYAAFTAAQGQGASVAVPASPVAPGTQPATPQPSKWSKNMSLLEEIRKRLSENSATFNTGTANPTNPAAQPQAPGTATPPAGDPGGTPIGTPVQPGIATDAPAMPQVPPTAPAQPGAAPDPGMPGTADPNAGGVIGFYAPGVKPPDDKDSVSFKAQRVIDTATFMVDSLISQGKLFSHARAAALAAFTSASFADETEGADIVAFTRADGTTVKGRVAMLAEMFEGVPRHSFFNAQLPVVGLGGNREEADKVKKAQEEGTEQAKRFNESMGAAAQASSNGTSNGTH